MLSRSKCYLCDWAKFFFYFIFVLEVNCWGQLLRSIDRHLMLDSGAVVFVFYRETGSSISCLPLSQRPVRRNTVGCRIGFQFLCLREANQIFSRIFWQYPCARTCLWPYLCTHILKLKWQSRFEFFSIPGFGFLPRHLSWKSFWQNVFGDRRQWTPQEDCSNGNKLCCFPTILGPSGWSKAFESTFFSFYIIVCLKYFSLIIMNDASTQIPF